MNKQLETAASYLLIGHSEERKFESLYETYQPMIRRVLYNMVGDAALEDLTQETFIKIWNGLPRFALKSTLKTWIYSVTIHTAVDYLRKKDFIRTDSSPTELDELMAPETTHLSGLGDSEVSARAIQRSLAELDEIHRSVLVLHYFEELDLNEISKALDIPKGTVKSRLHTGREKLKSLLTEKGIQYEA